MHHTHLSLTIYACERSKQWTQWSWLIVMSYRLSSYRLSHDHVDLYFAIQRTRHLLIWGMPWKVTQFLLWIDSCSYSQTNDSMKELLHLFHILCGLRIAYSGKFIVHKCCKLLFHLSFKGKCSFMKTFDFARNVIFKAKFTL